MFPNVAGGLRLMRAFAAETHEGRLDGNRYFNKILLKEQKSMLRLGVTA